MTPEESGKEEGGRQGMFPSNFNLIAEMMPWQQESSMRALRLWRALPKEGEVGKDQRRLWGVFLVRVQGDF